MLLTETYHPTLLQALQSRANLRIYSLPKPSPDSLLPLLAEAHSWVLRGAIPVTEALLQKAPNLRAIVRAGSGTEHIDKEALARRGIHLLSTPQANAAPVAEYVVGAIIALAHRILPSHHELREQNIWNRHSHIGRELASLTIGIIGFGHNGSRTAHLLAQLGATVLAYDKYKRGFAGNGIQEASLEEIWLQADVLSLHVPLTAETQGWIDKAFLERFRQPIALINIARGGIVSLPAVAEALAAGRLWGAALDTLPNEPPDKLSSEEQQAWDFLRKHPSVLLTPHIAGLTQESELRLARAVLAALEPLLYGYT